MRPPPFLFDAYEFSQKLDYLMEQMRLAKKKVYGASSEKSGTIALEQMSLFFNEAEAIMNMPEAKTTTVAEHTRKKRSSKLDEVLPENVPVEVVEHQIPEEERICPECGTRMESIGREFRQSLVLIPAQVKIREDVYYTYACQTCKTEGTETPILKTPKAPAMISGSFASPEAIAHIMVQKFAMGVPLYR